jgi:hypothetical protein
LQNKLPVSADRTAAAGGSLINQFLTPPCKAAIFFILLAANSIAASTERVEEERVCTHAAAEKAQRRVFSFKKPSREARGARKLNKKDKGKSSIAATLFGWYRSEARGLRNTHPHVSTAPLKLQRNVPICRFDPNWERPPRGSYLR